MASNFVVFAWEDHDFARALERQLRDKGHEPRLGAGVAIVGYWRSKLIRWLRESDVVLPLLSDAGYASTYACSEIGMARAFSQTQDLLVLPVVVGKDFRLDSFVMDFHCLHHDPDEETLGAVATKIDEAINQWANETPMSPRIFISHRHAERGLAQQLVTVLEKAFKVEKGDLRCTSVHPYTLKAGVRTSDKLRSEIGSADVVVGLISPVAADSKYVLAELGAAWGCGVPTFPLRVKGARFEHVPEPLNERHSLDLGNLDDCGQLVDDIADVTSLERRTEECGLIDALEGLREAATKPKKTTRN